MPYMTATIQHMHGDLVGKLDELSQAVDRLKGSVDALADRLAPTGEIPDPLGKADPPGKGWLLGKGR